MGYYINPTDKSKEDWLEEHGQSMAFCAWDATPDGHLPVCLVNNGEFTAAGICYDEREFDAFNSPSDPRSKKWIIVNKEDLLQVCPRLQYAL